MTGPLRKFTQPFEGDRLLMLFWALCSVAIVLPVWTQRMLPMLDTPNHLALVRGWHNYYDPNWHISDYYTLRIRPVPYIFFYGAIHLLLYVFSIEVANKIFLTAYLLLYPLAILSLARSLKRSAWHALPAFCLAFSPAWIYGFSSYMMATAFFYFALGALIRVLEAGDTPKRSDLWRLTAYCIALYFAHVLAWFVFGILAIVLLLREYRTPRRCLAPTFALLPTVLLALLAFIEDKGDRSYMREEGFAAIFRDVPTTILEFPRRVMELFPGPIDMVIFALICVVALVLWRLRPTDTDEELARRKRLKVILWALALLYLSLPYEITKPMSWWYVAPRIPALLFPILIVLPASVTTPTTRRILGVMVLAALALSTKLIVLYRDFSRRHEGFIELVEQTEIGSNTFVVVSGMWQGEHPEEQSGDRATSGPVLWHFSSWPMVLRGGIGPYVFDQGIPLRFHKKLQTPPWSMVDEFELRHAPAYDYYLVRFASEQLKREPSIREAGKRGDWTLFKRIHPLTEEP